MGGHIDGCVPYIVQRAWLYLCPLRSVGTDGGGGRPTPSHACTTRVHGRCLAAWMAGMRGERRCVELRSACTRACVSHWAVPRAERRIADPASLPTLRCRPTKGALWGRVKVARVRRRGREDVSARAGSLARTTLSLARRPTTPTSHDRCRAQP